MIDYISNLLESKAGCLGDALDIAENNLVKLGMGNHSVAFDIEGEYVIKISGNPNSFTNIDNYPHVDDFLVKYWGTTHLARYSFSFQLQGTPLESVDLTRDQEDDFYKIKKLLDNTNIRSPQWAWGEWAENEYNLDLCISNAGLFDNKIKFFDY